MKTIAKMEMERVRQELAQSVAEAEQEMTEREVLCDLRPMLLKLKRRGYSTEQMQNTLEKILGWRPSGRALLHVCTAHKRKQQKYSAPLCQDTKKGFSLF